MAEIRIRRLEQSQTKIKTVPIAVTPEGFWCCPSPVGFQKTPKTQIHASVSKPNKQTSAQKKNPLEAEKSVVTDEEQPIVLPNSSSAIEVLPRPKVENTSRKVTIEFGETGTSDLKLMLMGKQGITVELAVHRSVLAKKSCYFAGKLEGHQPVFPFIEIDECEEDVEMYIETIGLMYCKDLRQRLIKQNVARVLCILKVAERLGFSTCIETCLEYLEAVPWVGEEEEAKVVSSVLHLKGDKDVVKPVLKRVSAEVSTRPKDTLSQILELVLNSYDEKGRREMKFLVLKLLRENHTSASDVCSEKIYTSFRKSLGCLLSLLREAASGDESTTKMIAFEADNILWLLEILSLRQEADEFAVTWSNQHELASIHTMLPIVSRHHVSLITARLFVGIGKGEVLPDKETRHLLLKTWLQQLISDYRWLQNSCRSFDRGVVEEGIGRTILTLPLEEQQSVLLSWMESFLKTGDHCPNLRKAFEVWWRRTFVRPYVETETEKVDVGGRGGKGSKQRFCVGDVLEKCESPGGSVGRNG